MDTIIVKSYNEKLKNKLYGLLCEYEKGREWMKFLDSILVELLHCVRDEEDTQYYILYSKLASLRYLSYEYFRKTIFDCMDLIDKEL